MHEAVDREMDKFLSPEVPPGKCRGECEGANILKMHLIKQLKQQRLWPSSSFCRQSLAECRSNLLQASAYRANAKTCHATCVVKGMDNGASAFPQTETAVSKIMSVVKSTQLDFNEEYSKLGGFCSPIW